MKAVLAILVVAMLLCIVLSSEESDVLQCTGEKLSDGQYYFNIPYEVMEDIYDCETQWLVDEKVAGISDAEGELPFMLPIVNLSVTAAILQTCPKRLECLRICPSANINEKLQCSCDASTLTELPEGDASPTALPEVAFPNWSPYIQIGVVALVVLVIAVVIVIIVLYRKRQGSGYVLSGQASAGSIV